MLLKSKNQLLENEANYKIIICCSRKNGGSFITETDLEFTKKKLRLVN